jgi:hypothetical protein
MARAAGFRGAGDDAMNQIKILVDGDRLQIAGQNVDLDGISKLREMLVAYEQILKLSRHS